MGYQGIFSFWGTLGIISELRGVLLRTWGHPLIAETKQNYGGAELRCSFTAVFNISAGYYSPLSNTDSLESFWGFHAGIGM